MSSTFKLLCVSLRLDDDEASVNEAAIIIKEESVDWEYLLKESGKQAIRPQVEKLLLRLESSLVPAYVMNCLRDSNRSNLLRQLRSIKEYFEIRQALNDKEIVAIPFKGFWQSYEYYGNISEREAGDVDLFIDVNEIEKIKALMVARGYSEEYFFTLFKLNEIKENLGEYNFYKSEEGVVKFHFEFQWRISAPVLGMGIELKNLISQTKTGHIEGNELLVFNASANFLLAIMHHGGVDMFLKLKHIFDIGCILKSKKYINWPWVIDEAHKMRIEKLVYIGVKMASMVTRVEIPVEIKERVNSKEISNLAEERMRLICSTYDNSMKTHLYNFVFRIRSRNGFKFKINLGFYLISIFIRDYIVPTRIKDKYLQKFTGLNILKIS